MQSGGRALYFSVSYQAQTNYCSRTNYCVRIMAAEWKKMNGQGSIFYYPPIQIDMSYL